MRPNISYLICATHRTGSTLLCEALKNTGIAGQPEEYFWREYEILWQQRWETSSYSDYLDKVLQYATTPNGVFGAKVMYAYFDDFVNKMRQIQGYVDLRTHELISTFLVNPRYIWIRRRDKVRQAVSLYKAVQSQHWELYTNDPIIPYQELAFDFEAIKYWLQTIIRDEASWQEYFTQCGIYPFNIFYEDFVAAYEATILGVLRYLKIAIPEDFAIDKPQLRKLADTISEQWVQKYRHRQLTEVATAGT